MSSSSIFVCRIYVCYIDFFLEEVPVLQPALEPSQLRAAPTSHPATYMLDL
jgi:hypothetical protein